MNPPAPPLRIFCVEDNMLLVMQLQMLLEEWGYVFVGSAARFDDVKQQFGSEPFDLAIVDIDLADGRTGGEVAEWLCNQDRFVVFITGQEQIASNYAHCSADVIGKPLREERLRQVLSRVSEEFQGQASSPPSV